MFSRMNYDRSNEYGKYLLLQPYWLKNQEIIKSSLKFNVTQHQHLTGVNKCFTYFQLSIAVRVFVCCILEFHRSMFPVNCQTKTGAPKVVGLCFYTHVTGSKKMQTIS